MERYGMAMGPPLPLPSKGDLGVEVAGLGVEVDRPAMSCSWSLCLGESVCGEVGAVLEEVTAKETVKESSRQRKDRERGKRRGEGSEREMGEGKEQTFFINTQWQKNTEVL